MTDQERQDMKAKLIEMGVWGSDEMGDPLTTREDARSVHSRLEDRLVPTAFLAPWSYSTHSPARRIDVRRGKFRYPIAEGADYQEAICLAALRLPEFLRQHPEYAAKA